MRTIYKNKDDVPIVGVTTVLDRLGWNKHVLMAWANRIGREEGIKSSEFVDEKAQIGTLAHALITSRYDGIEVDLSDYSPNQVDQAKNSVKSYENWAKTHKIEPVWVEKPLVSEKFQFGGTVDVYCKNDGKLEIIDIKTGSGIYREAEIQVSAYKMLLEENGHQVESVRILNVPRTDNESFMEKIITDKALGLYWEVFLNLLNVYRIERRLKENELD